ncbi:hypothetical protein ACE6H2_001061 [Prunus campanulata]
MLAELNACLSVATGSTYRAEYGWECDFYFGCGRGSNGSPIWDRLVFNKIKEKLGGRVRFMGFGASPLSPDVMDFLRV